MGKNSPSDELVQNKRKKIKAKTKVLAASGTWSMGYHDKSQ